ncbi:hypothetical protein LK12_04770 [Novosphingobium malaysiense]|uniref:Uncharacterized protein n=1 Tax=Novosphingobium malaysiense TaxID=1348853 RepID=A0A0B1ZQX3_9SPHN|nr:hypothetical protein LK12_04770 [Novosphingobium malaysiense]
MDEVVQRVILDERAMALGAVLHHEGHPCEGGGLQGSNKAETLVSEPGRSPIDLSTWNHLQAKEGGFAAYKGSLINLGLFQAEDAEDDQDRPEDIDDEAEHASVALTSGKLSEKGEALAQSFAAAVEGAKYLDLEPTQAPITFDVLNEFGAKAGLCELREADSFDLGPLRDLFFAVGIEGLENSHYRRRMTLLLVLQAAHIADANGLELDNDTFNDMTFYRRLVLPDEAKSEIAVSFPPQLDDIAERWKIFYFHNYLTVALESLLAGVARSLRGHPAGRTIGEILDDFDDVDARMALAEHFEFKPTDSFQEMTPARSLAALGIDVAPLLQGSSSAVEALRSGEMIERRLRSLLVDTGFVRGPAGPAIAAMLLFSLALRYKCTVGDRYQGWNRQKVFNQQYDISLPGYLYALDAQFGDDWWHTSIREVMARS